MDGEVITRKKQFIRMFYRDYELEYTRDEPCILHALIIVKKVCQNFIEQTEYLNWLLLKNAKHYRLRDADI